MEKLLVVGAAVLDRIFYVNQLPKPGETVIGEHMEIFPGGKGANQALAAAKLDADVQFITSVGVDEAANIVLKPLSDAGINLDGIFRFNDVHTAEAIISVDKKGENLITACPGAYHRLIPELIIQREDYFENNDWLLIQNELPSDTVIQALKLARKHNCKIIFNPAPFRKNVYDIPAGIELIIPNEFEASGMLGIESYSSLNEKEKIGAWEKFNANNVLVTLGNNGGEWISDGSIRKSESITVDAVDSVGAGDAFCGALAAFLTFGEDINTAINYAHHAAALSVTKRGAQSGLPDRQSLEEFLKRNK